MNCSLYLYSEEHGLHFRLEPETNGETIWIRTGNHNASIALTMSREDRAKLRAVLDLADAAGGEE